MLNRCALSKSSWRYMSYSTSRKPKVRHLPKEYYREDETIYLPHRKPQKSFITDFLGVMQKEKWTFKEFSLWLKKRALNNIREDQTYLPDRHRTLGPDLATTHFITVRGGKVRFMGNDKWYTEKDIREKKLPLQFIPGFYVREIDASNTHLCYEGFDNLYSLRSLKKLILRNCVLVDDWCLNRTHLLKNTLEYLDISGCHHVTERGICTLHELKNLKTLVLEDTPNIQNKELVCLLLQDILPKCNIVGVDYDDPVLLARVEKYMSGKYIS